VDNLIDGVPRQSRIGAMGLWDFSEEEIERAYAALAGDDADDGADDIADDDDEEDREIPAAVDLPLIIRLANARMERELRDLVRDAGYADLSPAAVHALMLCGRGKPASALADRLLVTRQAAGQVVARLESLGLVERRPQWPATLAVPTPAGRSLVRALNARFLDACHWWGMHLAPGRLDALTVDLEVFADPERARWRRAGAR
jgi:DNA-binding MarR family transcriptional regulator